MDREGIEALRLLLTTEENNFLSEEVAIEYTCVLIVKAKNGDAVFSRQVQPPVADAIGDIVESLNAGAGHVISGGGATFEVSIRFDGRGLSKEELREVRRQRRMEKADEPRETDEPGETEEPAQNENVVEPLPEGTEPEPEDPGAEERPGRRRRR